MKVFEYRLRPNRAQEQALWSVLIGSRQMYNDALAEWKEHLDQTGTYLSLYTQDKGYNKQAYPDLPAVVVDQALKRLHRSLTRFFRVRKEGKACGFPRFKSANRWNSIDFRDATNSLQGRYFQAGKLCGGKIRTVVHRPLEGTFKHARIIKRPSGWYLQCVCDVPKAEPLPKTGNAVGLDMGIKAIVADSDGVIVPNPNHLKRELKNLAHSQRLLCRKTKGSRRKKKQAHVAARRHERVANRRKDALHKIARSYVDKNDIIVVEDLNVAGMLRNHHLARAISDASWSMLRQLLADKAESAGRQFVAVPAHFTSQSCSRCHEIVQKSLSVRTHLCPHCGYIADRDVNAAQNILQKGLALLANTGPDGAFVECPDGTR